jgi:hypothetical protein
MEPLGNEGDFEMKRPEWKDQTSYSRDDKERIPSSWVLKLTRDVHICVVRSHIYDRENWVMHCKPWFDTFSLNLPSTVENRDEAMSRAVALVREKIDEVTSVIRGIN